MIIIYLIILLAMIATLSFLLLWRSNIKKYNILFSSPASISLAITGIIFVVEISIMFIISAIQHNEIAIVEATIDAVVLSGIIIPIIYLWLRRQKKQIHSITDNTVDAIITINDKGIIEYYNPAAEVIFGYSQQDAIGQNVNILIPAPYCTKHDTYLDNYLRTGVMNMLGNGKEFIGKRKNGDIFPIHISISEIKNDDSVSYVSIIQDITDRKKAEEEIRQSNEKFQDFFFLNPEPSAITTLDGIFVYANQALMDMSEYSTDELIGKNVKDLHVWWELSDRNAMIRELQETGYVKNKEITGKTKSGKISYAIYSAKIILINDTRHILFIMQDINNLKLAEQAIRESEARYRLLIENSPLCIHEIGMDSRITSMNRAGLIMMDVGEESDVQGFLYLDAVCDADRPRIGELLAKAYTGEASYFEFKANGPGELIFKSCFVPIRDPNGDIYKLMGITEDITERKRAEEHIYNLNEELERKVKERTSQLEAANKELEAFTYSVSHDLRSPLRAIDGFSSVIAEDYADKLDSTGKDYLNRVRLATHKMGELIDDLLQLSRLTRGEQKKSNINLSQIAESVIANLRESEPDRLVQVEILPDMYGVADPHLLDVVLTNLLGNAWKYTSKTEKPKIEFGFYNENAKTIYYVKDNGAGFNMEYADKLFKPFQRLHTIAEFPGIGIGLATIERIIHKHGGEVWAQGKTDQGATFYFTLGE